jgi:iron complex outermembrane receptor protein
MEYSESPEYSATLIRGGSVRFSWLLTCTFLTIPGAALADDTPAADAVTDTVIVTARLRAENAQTVPAALSVVGDDLLARSYTVNTSQLTQLVPTLNYSSPNPRNTAYTIRGLGSSVVAISQANDGLEPGVGFYVDQVYHARPATAAFDMADLAQIEVLRGPQGTVFGKNTTAGAINIATRLPEFRYGAELEASFGQQGYRQLRGALTGPLVGDIAAFRLAGLVTRRGGVIYNVRTGQWQNDLHNDALRGQVLLTLATNFTLRLIGDWASFHSTCCTQVPVRVAPTLKPAAQQYAALAAGAMPGGYAPPSADPYARLTDIDASLGVQTSEGGLTSLAEWKAGNARITMVTAWRFWNWDAANDRDYTGLPIQLIQHVPSRQDQLSQELRIASDGPHRIDYVAGLYVFHQKITGHPISIYGPLATYWLLPAGRPANLLDGYQTDGITDFRSDSYAAFAELTWHLAPRLALNGGIRYTQEVKDGLYNVRISGGLTAGLTASLISDKNSILRAQSYTAHLDDGSASGRINLAYTVADGLLAYASYARGQKAGGINMSGLPVYPAGVAGHASGDPILSTVTVRPEQNTTWELGVKATALDRALTFNFAAYATRVRDFQANVVDNAAVIALRSYLANIPLVTVRGLELDAALRLGSHLSLRAAGAYADGRYASYPAAPCPIELTGSTIAQCDLTGKGLPGLPKWSGSLGGEWRQPLTGGEAILRADATVRSTIFGEAADSAYTVIPDYMLVNASLAFKAARHWEVAFYARNLFNRNYLQNVTVQAGNSGLIVGTPGDPRQFGGTLRLTY